MSFRVLDLFSGIGGFSLGLERTGGFETVAFCEIEPRAAAVLQHHWPSVPVHGDVTTRLLVAGEADVIVGGFPCQDISIAGGSAGLAGARSGLWRELVRAIRLVRPLYAIVENVAALLDRGMGRVLGDLAEIGHDAEWHCVPACSVGAPHRRDRVWIISQPNGSRRKGFKPYAGSLERQVAALSEHRDPFADAWRALDNGVSDLRERDGLSVGLERSRIHALGNAVVPQIPELIGRAILAAEQGRAAA